MPETFVVQHHRTIAVEAVGRYLEDLQGCRELRLAELRRYQNRQFILGWDLPIALNSRVFHFQLLVTETFPFTPAKIALADGPTFLTWPHVEQDGVLCLLPNESTVSNLDPVGAASDLLSLAIQLVEDCLSGRNLNDFKAEFQTYWNYEISGASKPCFTLIDLSNREDRLVRCWSGKRFSLIAHTESAIQSWLSNWSGGSKRRHSTVLAGLLWLDELPAPEGYPQTSHDVFEMFGRRKLLTTLIGNGSAAVHIVGASLTENGPALAGIKTYLPFRKNLFGESVNEVTKGFRPNHVPKAVARSRVFGSTAKVTRFKVERADRSWIHGRDHDESEQDLQETQVLIAGCGSLGSLVAVELARAGVGHIDLVDPESLSWANISRHALGAEYVDLNKSKGLAQYLLRQFPHLSVNAHTTTAEEFITSENCDTLGLIINTTGNWSVSSLLEAMRHDDHEFPPVLHGWMEARAAAGHSVLLTDASSLKQGFDALGTPLFRITQFDSATMKSEPACGAVFEPYGSIDLGHCVSIVSRSALDYMTNPDPQPSHRFWVGFRSKLLAFGGRWTDEWRSHPKFRDEGGFYVSSEWASGWEVAREIRLPT
jgi:hypothetical protein